MAKTDKEYLVSVGLRHPEELADGSQVEPGQVVTLTEEEQDEPQNKRLIEEGHLIHRDADTQKAEDKGPGMEELQAKAKKLKINQGGTKAELMQRIAEAEAGQNQEGDDES
jgi:hypothetical protein